TVHTSLDGRSTCTSAEIRWTRKIQTVQFKCKRRCIDGSSEMLTALASVLIITSRGTGSTLNKEKGKRKKIKAESRGIKASHFCLFFTSSNDGIVVAIKLIRKNTLG